MPAIIAFASDLLAPGNVDIYTMKSDGTNITRLTTSTAADDFPAFSADGQKIAFTSDRDDNSEIYVMDADGSNQTQVTNNTAIDLEPSWSPDGTQIAFASTRDGGDFDIFKLTLATSIVTQLTATPFTDSEPAWSPDGTQIAFISERNNINFFELFLMNTDGTSPAALLPGMTSVFGPSWSKDGSKLAFSKGISNLDEDLFIVDKSGTTGLLQLTSNSFVDRASSWSPDGGQLTFERIGGWATPSLPSKQSLAAARHNSHPADPWRRTRTGIRVPQPSTKSQQAFHSRTQPYWKTSQLARVWGRFRRPIRTQAIRTRSAWSPVSVTQTTHDSL